MRNFARLPRRPANYGPNFPPRPLGCRPGTVTWWAWRYYAGTGAMSAAAKKYLRGRAVWLDGLDAYAAAGDRTQYAILLLAGRRVFGWKERRAIMVGERGPYNREHLPSVKTQKPGRLRVFDAKKAYYEFCRRSFWGWLTGAKRVVERHLASVPWDRPLAIKTIDEHAQGKDVVKAFPDLLYMETLSALADEHPWMVIVKSRKMLVTWWACARILHRCLFTPHTEAICQCKKQEESNDRLLERMWQMYRSMPRWFTNDHPAVRVKNRIDFLDNGSRAVAAAEGPHPWRSPTASYGVIDEAAIMEGFEETFRAAKPALTGTYGRMPLLIVSTPNGKDAFYRLVQDVSGEEDDLEPYDSPVRGQIHGMNWRLNRNLFLSVDLGHEADPEKDPETPAGHVWWKQVEAAYRGDPFGLLREYKRSWDTNAGKPVYGLVFKREIHVLEGLQYIPGKPVYRGWDFGYHRPACLWGFENEYRQLVMLYELLGKDLDITPFTKRVLELSKQWFPEAHQWVDFADPQGWAKSDVSDKTRIQVLNAYGIKAAKGEVYAVPRTDVVRHTLAPRSDGKPGIVFHPRCKILIDACAGAYRYPEPRPDLPESVASTPLKDGFYDHLANGLEYLVTGLRMVTGKMKNVTEEQRRQREDPYEGVSEVTGW